MCAPHVARGCPQPSSTVGLLASYIGRHCVMSQCESCTALELMDETSHNLRANLTIAVCSSEWLNL